MEVKLSWFSRVKETYVTEAIMEQYILETKMYNWIKHWIIHQDNDLRNSSSNLQMVCSEQCRTATGA